MQNDSVMSVAIADPFITTIKDFTGLAVYCLTGRVR